jgi:hypothetical protein
MALHVPSGRVFECGDEGIRNANRPEAQEVYYGFFQKRVRSEERATNHVTLRQGTHPCGKIMGFGKGTH